MKWSAPGLNIFLSVKVSELPIDLFPFTTQQRLKTLCIIGSGGKSLWEELPQPKTYNLHPFDHYTLNHIQLYSKEFLNNDCEILFPNNSLTLPLQKMSCFLNFSSQSPIGLDICHEFGLWFAFRGVFLTSHELVTTKYLTPPLFCVNCLERPCLTETNIGHARKKCLIKNEHQYDKDQLSFHESALADVKF